MSQLYTCEAEEADIHLEVCCRHENAPQHSTKVEGYILEHSVKDLKSCQFIDLEDVASLSARENAEKESPFVKFYMEGGHILTWPVSIDQLEFIVQAYREAKNKHVDFDISTDE